MNKFICKKVKKVRFYHSFITWFALTFLKIEIFYCTEDVLKKEMNKRKRLIRNLKKLIKDSSEKVREQFKKGIEEMEKWQEEVKVMEEELKRV